MRFMFFHKLFRTKAYQQHMILLRRNQEAIDHANQMAYQRVKDQARRDALAARARAEARFASTNARRKQEDEPVQQGLAYATMDEPWTPSFHHHKAKDDEPVYKGSSGTFDGAGASSNWTSSDDRCSTTTSSGGNDSSPSCNND